MYVAKKLLQMDFSQFLCVYNLLHQLSINEHFYFIRNKLLTCLERSVNKRRGSDDRTVYDLDYLVESFGDTFNPTQ